MNEKFEIVAHTYVLKNSSSSSKSIIGGGVGYTIPVYQRPYSWKEEQVVRLIRDIFASFYGVAGDKKSEPMFIGTMQLKPEGKETYVIDGQQRLTTLLILLKVLQLKYSKDENLELISLESKVAGQQEYLQNLINLPELPAADAVIQNNYIRNARLINAEIDKQIEKVEKAENSNEETTTFEIQAFRDYLFTQVHFVVIRTTAGLSKTLKIFDAINTTGLDLNTGDIFKIRMYEYLKDKGNGEKDTEIFNNINGLYEEIDKLNKKFKTEFNIQQILRIYQFYLIGKYDLPVVLYSFATDTFYERLFETIFKINTAWPNFQKIGELKLDLEVINDLVTARFRRHEIWLEMDAEAKMYQYLWSWSRYGNLKVLMDIFLYQQGEEQFNEFVERIVKLYLQYSLAYGRSVYGIQRSFTDKIIKEILNCGNDGVPKSLLEQKLSNEELGTLSGVVGEKDNNLLKHPTRVKNIVCRLSASLTVLTQGNLESQKAEEIKQEIERIFTEKMDIEHIQSYTDEKEKTVPEGWKETINSLGNLVLLERKINRRISNDTGKKLGEEGYKESKLTIVKNVLNQVKDNNNWDWTPEKAKAKQKGEVDKILNFLGIPQQ